MNKYTNGWWRNLTFLVIMILSYPLKSSAVSEPCYRIYFGLCQLSYFFSGTWWSPVNLGLSVAPTHYVSISFLSKIKPKLFTIRLPQTQLFTFFSLFWFVCLADWRIFRDFLWSTSFFILFLMLNAVFFHSSPLDDLSEFWSRMP